MAQDLQISIQISGVPQVQRRFRAMANAVADAAGAGLLQSAFVIYRDADQSVPVLTGNLRASGKVLGPVSLAFGAGRRVEVEYGGRADRRGAGFPVPSVLRGGRVTYAAFQHANNPRRAGWLEHAAEREFPQTPAKVAAAVATRLQVAARVV